MAPSCTFLLGALLAVVASAQFPGLPKINPKQIAGVVRNAENDVKQTVSQTKIKDRVSEVAKEAKGLRSQTPSAVDNVAAQSATQAASSAAVQAAEAGKAVAGDTQTRQHVGDFFGPSSLATATPAPAPVVSEGSNDVHAGKLLESVQGQVNQVLQDSPKSLPEATDMPLDSKDLRKAAETLQDAHDFVQASKGPDPASKTIPGLTPSMVTERVGNVVDGASQNAEAVKPMIPKVLKSDPESVAHAAEKEVKLFGKIDPSSVRKRINSDDPEESEQPLDVEEAAEKVGPRWQWSLLVIASAAGVLFFAWQAKKRRDSRSPTLLAGSDLEGL